MISQYDEAEGKKAEETKRERGGLLPPPPPAVFVSAQFFFRRLLHQNAWSRLLWRYSSVTARKKDTKIMTVLFAGADGKRSLYCMPDFKFN